MLLREEMRRTLVVLDHQAVWWRKQGLLRAGCEPVLASGLHGYAEKQATIRERLASDFASIWLTGISDSGLAQPITWPVKYLGLTPSLKKVKLRLQRNKLRLRVINYVKDSNVVSQPPLSFTDLE